MFVHDLQCFLESISKPHSHDSYAPYLGEVEVRSVERHKGMHFVLPPSVEGHPVPALDVRRQVFRCDDKVFSVDNIDGARQGVFNLAERKGEGAFGNVLCGDRLHLGLAELGPACADR